VLAGLRELGNQELVAELAEFFLEDASSKLEALREAIRVGDAPSAERVAHTLKESCGNMGALRMSAIFAELQYIGNSGELGRAPLLVDRLGAEFARVRMELEVETER
jgi:HPt (histidine-containing phosphotransfer) domain-containing protein